MKLLQNKVNVTAPDATWLYGDINNNSGSGDGTPLDKEFTTDMANFFERLIALSSITANGLPDNETNDWQLYEAFLDVTKPRPYLVYTALIVQSGTSAPTVTVLENEIGTIVWTYGAVGIYVGTLASAFTTSKTWNLALGGINVGDEALIVNASSSTIQVQTYTAGVGANNVLGATTGGSKIEIRVYP